MYSIKRSVTAVMLISGMAALCFFGCKKDQKGAPSTIATTSKDTIISPDILAKIKAAGFSTKNAIKMNEGYLVEGDIMLTDAFLNSNYVNSKMVIAAGKGPHLAADQYSVTSPLSLPHTSLTTYKVLVSGLSSDYSTAAVTAISRYNSLNLGIRFQSVASGPADVVITGYTDASTTLEAYSGFPVNNVIYNAIHLNQHWCTVATTANILFTASVIQHELGHCIGMRHTDYANTTYSCGTSGGTGELNDPSGAVLIPGTPSGPDALSYMLACNDFVSNRTFNANDKIALNYLFPYVTINGAGSYNWFNGNGSGSGTINSNPGTLVYVTVSAFGPGTTTYFAMTGAPLNGAPGGVVYMQNNTSTHSFVMPSSGSVNWNGSFTRTGTSGAGDIAVN